MCAWSLLCFWNFFVCEWSLGLTVYQLVFWVCFLCKRWFACFETFLCVWMIIMLINLSFVVLNLFCVNDHCVLRFFRFVRMIIMLINLSFVVLNWFCVNDQFCNLRFVFLCEWPFCVSINHLLCWACFCVNGHFCVFFCNFLFLLMVIMFYQLLIFVVLSLICVNDHFCGVRFFCLWELSLC